MSTVKLQTSDKEILEVELAIAKCSKTIKTMIEDCGLSGEDVIPLPNVNAETMRRVIQWAEYHKDPIFLEQEEKPSPTEINNISPWDREFLAVDQWILRDIMLAANYLDIPKLLHTSCKVVAKMIQGKSPDELRVMFRIQNDLVDEDATAAMQRMPQAMQVPDAKANF